VNEGQQLHTDMSSIKRVKSTNCINNVKAREHTRRNLVTRASRIWMQALNEIPQQRRKPTERDVPRILSHSASQQEQGLDDVCINSMTYIYPNSSVTVRLHKEGSKVNVGQKVNTSPNQFKATHEYIFRRLTWKGRGLIILQIYQSTLLRRRYSHMR